MNEGERDELIGLANAYIEGRLEAAAKERLEGRLQRDPEARRVFTDFLHVHSSLYWGHIPLGELSADELGISDVDGGAHVAKAGGRMATGALVLAAVGLACLMAVAGLFLLRSAKPAADAGEAGIASAGAPRSGAVARVVHVQGQATAGGGRALAAGDALDAGEVVRMEEGLIELVFLETGVYAIATASLKMELGDSKLLRLEEGEMKLHVPPQGIGFVVETPERQITDLGTSFVVTARSGGSKVLVLDGEVAVSEAGGGAQRRMEEGEFADFRRGGEASFDRRKLSGLPELSPVAEGAGGLPGRVVSFENRPGLPVRSHPPQDHIGRQVLPLIRSGFQDESCLEGLRQSGPVRFGGIAGAYGKFPVRAGLGDFPRRLGWLAWFSGKVVAPKPGRYRFWGYADNHLVVAVDGTPVFEGSRFGSSFPEELGVARSNHLAFPCLNAEAGFASGAWIELGAAPVQLDLLFGEMSNPYTSALLLVECEGDAYEETFWGQPRWPIFLTASLDAARSAELRSLARHLEDRLKGAFSVSADAVWQPVP